jgi:hypothetical protein
MTLGAEGEEALANKGWVKTRRHDNYTRGKKGLHLLEALDLPATLEAGRPLLLLLLLLLLPLVPLGEITPRWWCRRWDRWWWRLWWRRTRWWWRRRNGAPLCALGLGAGLLGPTSYPLMLLGGSETRGGSETSDPSARRSRRRLSSSDPSVPPGAEEPPTGPLPFSKGLGAAAGALGATPADWGPPTGTPGIWIPRRGSRPPV